MIFSAGAQKKTYKTSHNLYAKIFPFIKQLDRQEHLVFHTLAMNPDQAHLS